jgi:four helix bundle protein
MLYTEKNIWKVHMAKSTSNRVLRIIWRGKESQAGSSKADFNNKVRIALREMRESNYWLRIIKSIVDNNILGNDINLLIDESNQLKKILGSIVTKTNK